ncbi:MAG: phosphoribosylglycinamide formyltransferase [Deltaproteobacteria bacterium]|nr:phosphoribosylglycinamide formyltransferase [Deltaproteobacteria bacterium]
MTARLVVLASGQGTNLQALLDACRGEALPARVVGVVSHTASALALARAERAGLPGVFVAPPGKGAGAERRAAWDGALAERVAAMEPDVVVLAGWMRLLGPAFLDHFPGRVVNLHPALPGELPGLHAIERAWDEAVAGRRTRTGVMVHLAVPEVDAGPVLAYEVIPIDTSGSLEALEAAVHAVEHRLIVEGVRRALEMVKSHDKAG